MQSFLTMSANQFKHVKSFLVLYTLLLLKLAAGIYCRTLERKKRLNLNCCLKVRSRLFFFKPDTFAIALKFLCLSRNNSNHNNHVSAFALIFSVNAVVFFLFCKAFKIYNLSDRSWPLY